MGLENKKKGGRLSLYGSKVREKQRFFPLWNEKIIVFSLLEKFSAWFNKIKAKEFIKNFLASHFFYIFGWMNELFVLKKTFEVSVILVEEFSFVRNNEQFAHNF